MKRVEPARVPARMLARAPTLPAMLRALTLTARPPVNPTQAALRLQLVDARTGNPIPAVQITATGPAGSNPVNAASDASGRVELTGLPPGAYTLTASAAGVMRAGDQAMSRKKLIGNSTGLMSPTLTIHSASAPCSYDRFICCQVFSIWLVLSHL